ncbi:cytochrome c oxidase accessory protein CcoG [Pseudomonas sp. OIL-1]|uniref:cytochrome c oxidase accessory protein CcoG n=1 Tax=Pseudomonas sp. OIL-1 TaxID=2706126 RepID=UPI0013A77386|nr:cytochrome c oxidase accessory protein CcoG [Pseudomonas sp. OIL-1]QIB50711.1 cytochrome c oxidase accessory protein CcoG [Pseudomonas sp. OIL-1]
MSEQIPVKLVETIDRGKPARLTPAQSGGPIHTRSFTGFFRNVRLLGVGALFLLFFGTVWLDWDGRQAVLWDLTAKKFYIFGATFWPQDFVLLSALLMICAFGLFFITVVAGRIWCGYACPQSVWTWVFMWAEKVTEGDHLQRLKLDAAPWSGSKILKRSAKHALWVAVSLVTAITFVGYFTPIKPLVSDLVSLEVGLTAAFWVFFFSAATYINAGWLREKVCTHMCPYSRFQGAMFDQDTLLVTYDAARGEARGPRKRDIDHKAAGLGDCIDCTVCVQVCPTGIDIRDGLQLDCISCGACVDACDDIMERMGYEPGLIRYTSERGLNGGKTQWLRPRMVGYAALLALMIGSFVWALDSRSLVLLDVTRDRQIFRENAEGQIENAYTLKVINKSQQQRDFNLSLAGSSDYVLGSVPSLSLAPGEIRDVPVYLVRVNDHLRSGSDQVRFVVTDRNDASISQVTDSTFVSPRLR